MRISDWSSDVCSSDLSSIPRAPCPARRIAKRPNVSPPCKGGAGGGLRATRAADAGPSNHRRPAVRAPGERVDTQRRHAVALRSEEHTSELQSLMRSSFAVFCMNKKTSLHHLYLNHTITIQS